MSWTKERKDGECLWKKWRHRNTHSDILRANPPVNVSPQKCPCSCVYSTIYILAQSLSVFIGPEIKLKHIMNLCYGSVCFSSSVKGLFAHFSILLSRYDWALFGQLAGDCAYHVHYATVWTPRAGTPPPLSLPTHGPTSPLTPSIPGMTLNNCLSETFYLSAAMEWPGNKV